MTDLHDDEMTGTISTARHQVVRYRAGHESGDLFEEGQDFDGLTLTIEVADAADAQAMLDAISGRATPADDLRVTGIYGDWTPITVKGCTEMTGPTGAEVPFAYAWRWKGGVTWKLTFTKKPNHHPDIEIKELFARPAPKEAP